MIYIYQHRTKNPNYITQTFYNRRSSSIPSDHSLLKRSQEDDTDFKNTHYSNLKSNKDQVYSQIKPKFNYEEEKENYRKVKEAMDLNTLKKKNLAKELKERNRLMKENVLMLKEKMKEENIQKRKIVEIRYKIISHAIENYKNLKKEYIDYNFEEDIENELKIINKKKNELRILKKVKDSNDTFNNVKNDLRYRTSSS